MTGMVTTTDLILVAPELLITLTGLVVLLLGLALRRRNPGWLAGVSLLGTVGALSLVIWQAVYQVPGVAFSGLHVVDDYAGFFKVVFLLSAAIVILLSVRFLVEHGLDAGEFYSILLFGTLGTMLMASAVDLLSL